MNLLMFSVLVMAAPKWERCYPNNSRTEAWCTSMDVPLDGVKAQPSISISIVKLPSIRPNPEPDPLVLLAGGPGQSAINSIATVLPSLSLIQQNRDLLFIDQRGTGSSQPLDCQIEQSSNKEWDSPESLSKLKVALKECVEEWPYQSQFFTTAFAASDLEAIRIGLNIPQLNLYGISYGTRLAQVYMRQFPSSTRSVILDGVVPMTIPIGENVVSDAQSSLEILFEQCAEDESCQSAFPNLRQSFSLLISQVEEESEYLLKNPTTGDSELYSLSPNTIVSGIRMALYFPTLRRLLPYAVNEANKGHMEPLLAQTIHPAMQMNDSINVGLYYTIYCAEDVPRLKNPTQKINGIMGILDATYGHEICDIFPAVDIEPEFFEPVVSDLPTLLLSGKKDPITPPRYAELLGGSLKNHQHIIANQGSHNVGTMPCGADTMAVFIESPEALPLQEDCLETYPTQPWLIHRSGGQP